MPPPFQQFLGAVHPGFPNVQFHLLFCLCDVRIQAALFCRIGFDIEAHELPQHLLEKDGDGISGKRTIGVYPVVFADILYVSTEHIGIKPLHIDPGISICRHIGK